MGTKRVSTVYSDKVPFYSDLSIKANAQQLKMMLSQQDIALFETLLALSELTKKGWTQPFRKDMTGQKKLYGLMTAMLTRPATLLVYDPLVEMAAKQREAFTRMIKCFIENGCTFIYTAKSLKDAMHLELRQELWLRGKDGFIKTDTDAVSSKCAELLPEQIDELYSKMEAGENV